MFKFTAYNRELRILNVNKHDVIFCEVFENGMWERVPNAWPTILTFGMDTKEKTDEAFLEAMQTIIDALEDVFGGDVTPEPEPSSGVDRINWLIDNKLYVENGKLKINLQSKQQEN